MDTPPPDAEDGDFEVTAEMLIHDTMDDETTLAEEEAMRTQEEDEAELNELQEEGDMPLEQLLALYGYASTSSTSTSDASASSTLPTSEDQPQTKLLEPTPSNRSRRRNRVVPLQPQKELVQEAIDEPTTASSNKEDLPEGTGGKSTSELQSETETELGERLSGGKFTSEEMATAMDNQTTAADQEIGKGTDQEVSKAEQEVRKVTEQKVRKELEAKTKLTGQEVAMGVEPTKGKREGQEDTDGEEVDVVEVGEVQFELDRQDEETVLGLDPLQRAEFDVVRMGDIEAGLRIDGGTLGELEEAELSGSERAYTGYEEVDLEGQEEEEGMDERRDLQERSSDAVYDDVLLSSGNTRLLSETTDVPTFGEEPASSAAPTESDTNLAKTYTRGARLRAEIPERRSMRLMNSDDRALLYFASVLSDGSGSESDEEYSPQEDWKKEPKLGESHQALVPDYAPATPYPTTATKSSDKLMWSPRGISEEEVSAYLKAVSEIVDGVSSDSKKDHEKALEVLQRCGHNVSTALVRMQAQSSVEEGMTPWTEEECRRFEEGLRAVRKDFFHLQRKVATRTVKEVVEFYYLWKKTERYDHFIQQYGKVGRKKTLIPPGHMSDFMDKYLDMHGNDAMDIHYLTTTVQAEMKKDNS